MLIYKKFAVQNCHKKHYKLYETLRWAFSKDSGYFTIPVLKMFCEANGLKYDTLRRKLNDIVVEGWITLVDGLYHIESGPHEVYKEYLTTETGSHNFYEKKIRQGCIQFDGVELLYGSDRFFRRTIMNTFVDEIGQVKESKEKTFKSRQAKINKSGHYSKKVFNPGDNSYEKHKFFQSDLSEDWKKISNILSLSTTGIKMLGGGVFDQLLNTKKYRPSRTVAPSLALNCSKIIGIDFPGEIYSFKEFGDRIEVIASQSVAAKNIRWSKSDKDLLSIPPSANPPRDEAGGIIAERLVKTIIQRTKVSNKILSKKMGHSNTTTHSYLKESEALGELSVLRTLWVLGEYNPNLVLSLNCIDQSMLADGLQFRAVRLKASSVRAMRFSKNKNYYVKYDNLFENSCSYKDAKYLTVLILTNQYAKTRPGQISGADKAFFENSGIGVLKD